ncbi:BppU family phage baseplate upper protein [Enterococcus faecium]|uniref:BppU family phage baseplate upper protein n=2 Tax=Enterococcus TaxID=1350 RepID=UPI00319E24E5
MFKINESIIVIQAEATSPNRTNVVFWSHDRGTAKLRMKLVRKDGIPQSLPEGTTVPIRLMFKSATAEGGYGKHDYLATVEDPVNGIVSIVLEDNILGYVGTVEGSVYIDFPNDRSLDTAGRFTFYIKRSPIDDSTPELEDYYFNGFSQTIDKVEKILADGKQEIDQKIAESETQIDAKLKDTNDKITKANQDVVTLNTNIDKADERIDQANQKIDEVISSANEFRTDIDTLKINKADKTFVDAQLATMMTQTEFDSWVATLLDGGPSIFFDTYNQLVTEYPQGAAGVALIRETDPSRIYIWNPIETYWEDFGAYQGLEPKDGTITKSKLASTVADGSDLMASGVNLANTLNTTNSFNYGWVGNTGNDPNCVFSTDFVNGHYRYKIDTNSNFIVPSSKPTLNFKNTSFPIQKDAVLVIKNIATTAGSLQVDLYDAAGVKVNTIYVPIVASTTETKRTVSIPKGTAVTAKITSFTWTSVAAGVGYIYVYGFDLYYPDEERTNLKLKVNTLTSDTTNLKSQVTILNGDSNSLSKVIKDTNRLLINKGKVIHTFTSYDTIEKGSASIGSLIGMNTENPLKLVVNTPNGYCDFTKNIALTFKANNVYGLWFWVERENIIKTYSLKVFADSSEIFTSLYTEFNYENGWNYITFIPTIDITCSTIRVEYRVKSENASDTIPFYIDSIVENRKLKPCILLGFDNSKKNLYDTIYPLLKERGFVGTFAWQMGNYPGSTTAYLTQAQFDELMGNGWDYAMYGYVGTPPSDISDWSQYDTLYNVLKSYVDLLKSKGISTPVSYFCPNNKSTAPLIKALKSLGFKLLRNRSTQELIGNYDFDSFETSCFQIRDINDSLLKAKARIDTAIQTGQSLRIFTHEVVTSTDSTGLNVSSATYTDLLNYIKEKVDAGLIEVVADKEFYKRAVNSIRNISDVDFERLLFRLDKLEELMA